MVPDLHAGPAEHGSGRRLRATDGFGDLVAAEALAAHQQGGPSVRAKLREGFDEVRTTLTGDVADLRGILGSIEARGCHDLRDAGERRGDPSAAADGEVRADAVEPGPHVVRRPVRPDLTGEAEERLLEEVFRDLGVARRADEERVDLVVVAGPCGDDGCVGDRCPGRARRVDGFERSDDRVHARVGRGSHWLVSSIARPTATAGVILRATHHAIGGTRTDGAVDTANGQCAPEQHPWVIDMSDVTPSAAADEAEGSAEPTQAEIDDWAKREKARRAAWLAGPTDEERREYASNLKHRRLSQTFDDGEHMVGETVRRGLHAGREGQLAAEGAVEPHVHVVATLLRGAGQGRTGVGGGDGHAEPSPPRPVR